jgi:4-alpha-glucanotransferase
MKVLQFAFSDDAGNTHLPHNYSGDFVAYTGTHDNDTTKGWIDSLSKQEKEQIQDYMGTGNLSSWDFIRKAEESVARIAIVPMQDILGLGTAARMNKPGTVKGNWLWRMSPSQLKRADGSRLYKMTLLFGR